MSRLIAATVFASLCGAVWSQPVQDDHDVGEWVPLLGDPGHSRAETMFARLFDRIEYRKDFLFHDGQYWECIGLLWAQQGMYPGDGEINSTLAWMYGNVERQDLAYTTISRFRNEFPTDETGALTEAEWCNRRKLYTRVPPILEPVIQKATGLGVFVLLERAYMEMGLWHEALRVLQLRADRINDVPGQAKLKRLKDRLGIAD